MGEDWGRNGGRWRFVWLAKSKHAKNIILAIGRHTLGLVCSGTTKPTSLSWWHYWTRFCITLVVKGKCGDAALASPIFKCCNSKRSREELMDSYIHRKIYIQEYEIYKPYFYHFMFTALTRQSMGKADP